MAKSNAAKFSVEGATLNQNEVRLFLDSVIRQDGHPMPVCLCGNPGIGKSQIIQEVCAKYGVTYENGTYHEVRASLLVDSSDVTGLPVIQKLVGQDKQGKMTEYGHVTKYSIPDMLPCIKHDADGNEIPDNRKHVLFFDEINRSADPSIMNAIFQLTTEFRIGVHKLVPNCVVLLAINPENTGYAVNEMCPALVNRINFQYMKAEVQPWLEYARSKNIDSVITDFIDANPEELAQDGIVTNEGQDKRFPTPRAWFNVDKLLKSLHLSYNTTSKAALSIKLIAGIVGWQSATKFVAFARTNVQDRPLTGKEVLKSYADAQDMQDKVTAQNDMGMRLYDTVKTTTTLNSLKDEFKARGTKIKKSELRNMLAFLKDIAPENALSFQDYLLKEVDKEFSAWFFNQVFADSELKKNWESLQQGVTNVGVGSNDLL